VPGNQYWERPKDRLARGPLQALHAAVINVSILELCNVAIEGPEFQLTDCVPRMPDPSDVPGFR
jgi:hypothetical protein